MRNQNLYFSINPNCRVNNCPSWCGTEGFSSWRISMLKPGQSPGKLGQLVTPADGLRCIIRVFGLFCALKIHLACLALDSQQAFIHCLLVPGSRDDAGGQASLTEIFYNSHALYLRLIVPHGYFYSRFMLLLGILDSNQKSRMTKISSHSRFCPCCAIVI